MMKVKVNQDVNVSNLKHKKAKNEKKSHVGTAAALAAGMGVSTATTPLTLGVSGLMKKYGQVSEDKVIILKDAAQEILEKTGLKDKGVNIQYVDKAKHKLKDLIKNPNAQISAGINAGFAPLQNKIYMPKNDIQFATFHEIGHAHNYNFSKLGKLLQCMRMPGVLIGFGLLLYGAISKESKSKDGKELTKLQKTNNFIRNNAGKLSFTAMVPMLVEELMATLKGKKFASNILDKSMMKHVNKGSAIAYSTYILTAVGVGLASMAAVKIKNHFVNKKEAQNKAIEMQNMEVAENQEAKVS